jgi:hypothetical protein
VFVCLLFVCLRVFVFVLNPKGKFCFFFRDFLACFHPKSTQKNRLNGRSCLGNFFLVSGFCLVSVWFHERVSTLFAHLVVLVLLVCASLMYLLCLWVFLLVLYCLCVVCAFVLVRGNFVHNKNRLTEHESKTGSSRPFHSGPFTCLGGPFGLSPKWTFYGLGVDLLTERYRLVLPQLSSNMYDCVCNRHI